MIDDLEMITTPIFDILIDECDYNCMYCMCCNRTLQEHCCEKSEEEERKRGNKNV